MEDYQELLDETEDELEETQDLQESQLDSYGVGTYPEAKEQQNIYNWFWKVVKLKEPLRLVRVGNLTTQEIGPHQISIRDAMNLNELGKTFGHKIFGNYFATIAKIISVTSMAKKGWFMDLSISQKRVRARERSSQPSGEQSWRVFKKRRTQAQE